MLNNLNVGPKLYMLIGFLSILLVSIGFLGLHSARLSDDGLNTVYKDRVVPLKDLKINAEELQRLVMQFKL
jgi:methyl-accepting chemotaxis protein